MKFKAAPMPPGQFAVLEAIYNNPLCSGMLAAERAGMDKRSGYMMISRLRRLRLIRSRYVRVGSVTFAEHEVTSKGHRFVHAWLRFIFDCGGLKTRRELNLV